MSRNKPDNRNKPNNPDTLLNTAYQHDLPVTKADIDEYRKEYNAQHQPITEEGDQYNSLKDKYGFGGANKIKFIKNGKMYTRKLQINKRGTKYVRFNNKDECISKLKIVK